MSELEDLDCAEQGHRWLSCLCYILLIFFMMQCFARPNIIVPVKILNRFFRLNRYMCNCRLTVGAVE